MASWVVGVWVWSASFQKSNIGWPQQPPTEMLLISVKNWIFEDPFHKKGPALVILVPGMIQPYVHCKYLNARFSYAVITLLIWMQKYLILNILPLVSDDFGFRSRGWWLYMKIMMSMRSNLAFRNLQCILAKFYCQILLVTFSA